MLVKELDAGAGLGSALGLSQPRQDQCPRPARLLMLWTKPGWC